MIKNLGRHIVGTEREMVTSCKAGKLCSHVHLQVLEEVNVL